MPDKTDQERIEKSDPESEECPGKENDPEMMHKYRN
jgi:hypothetical protein